MIRANVSTMKSQLSRYLRQVKAGREVVIAERDRPVAKLVPYRAGSSAAEGWGGRLAELERRGEVRLSTGAGKPLRLKPARAPRGRAKVVEALLDERRQGR